MTVDPAWMELVLLLVPGFVLFLMESLCFSIYKIRTLVNGNNSTFFLIYMPFTSSCCLITLRLTVKCWIEVLRASRHPCLIPFLSGKTLNIMLMSPDFWMGWANLCCRDRDMYGVKSQYGVMKLGTVQTGILWRPMVGNGDNKKIDRKMKISQRKNKKNLEI